MHTHTHLLQLLSELICGQTQRSHAATPAGGLELSYSHCGHTLLGDHLQRETKTENHDYLTSEIISFTYQTQNITLRSKAPIRQNVFFTVRSTYFFFIFFFLLAVSVLHTVYVPKEPRVLAACCTSSFCRSALLKKEKKRKRKKKQKSTWSYSHFLNCPF